MKELFHDLTCGIFEDEEQQVKQKSIESTQAYKKLVEEMNRFKIAVGKLRKELEK